MSEREDELEELVSQFVSDLDRGVERQHVLRSAIGRGIDIGVRAATEHLNARMERLLERVEHLEQRFSEAQQRAVKAETERDHVLEEMKAAIARIERRMRSGAVSIPREEGGG